MNRFDKFGAYIFGMDTLAERLDYHAEHKKDSAGTKLVDAIDTVLLVAERLVPLGLEVTAAALAVKGHYQWASISLIAAEGYRAREYQTTKQRRWMNDLVERVNFYGRQEVKQADLPR